MTFDGGKAKLFVSLDGHGTKGYSQALILHEIEQQIQRRPNSSEVSRLSDHIDLIGGSGMSGILAIFVGRLRMTGDRALASYERLHEQVYGGQSDGDSATKYKWMEFETCFREIASEAGHNADDPMEEDNPQCKTVVFAQTASTREPQPIRSYEDRSGPNPSFSILQAACATIASPDLFPSVHVDLPLVDKEFVSLLTNPVEYILEEARMVFPESTPVCCILSIGSGGQIISTKLGDTDQNGQSKTLILDDCDHDAIHERIATWFTKFTVYHRLNAQNYEHGMHSNEGVSLERVRAATYAYIKEHENLFHSLTRKITTPMKGPPFMYNLNRPPVAHAFPFPPKLSPAFVGHSELIESIITYQTSPQSSATPQHRITLLHGRRGSGKTQISIKVSQELVQREPSLLLLVLDARSITDIEAGLRSFIRSQNVGLWQCDHQVALKWLSETQKPWLIVFQNADDMDISSYIPEGEGGHIIVTCQTPVSIKAPHSNYFVDGLNDEEAVSLLLATACHDHSEHNVEHARKIVAELGYHPFALSHAGLFIRRICPIQDYAREFSQTREKLMPLMGPGAHDDDVPTHYPALQLSFNQLPSITQDILRIFGFLSGFQIEDELLIRAILSSFTSENKLIDQLPFQRDELARRAYSLQELFCLEGVWDSYEFDQRIAPAIHYSLLSVAEGNHRRKFYSIHPLTQQFLHDSLPHDKVGLKNLATQLIISTIGITNSLHLKDPSWNQQLLPHLLSVPLVNTPLPVDCYTMARVLKENGRHREAERVIFPLNDAVIQRNITGVDELYLRTHQLLVSLWINSKGYRQSDSLDVLDICKRGCTHEDQRILTMMQTLAELLKRLGNSSHNIVLQTHVVESAKKLLGEEDPFTLKAIQTLASTESTRKNYTQAIALQQQVVEILKRVNGPEHANTLLAITRLARMLINKGDHRIAAQVEGGNLEAKKRVLGETNLETIGSMETLLAALKGIGEDEKAVELNVQLIRASETAYGIEHDRTLVAKISLAKLFSKQRNFVQAIKVRESVLSSQRKIYGEKDSRTLAAAVNLGADLSSQGELVRAEKILRNALVLVREVKDEDDRLTVNAITWLANNLFQGKRYSEAAELYERRLHIMRRTRGEKHPETIESEKHLASVLAKIQSGQPQADNPLWSKVTRAFKSAFDI